MKHLIKKRNFWVILSIDIFLLCLAYFLAYFIRFEGKIPPNGILNFKNTVWLIIPFKLLVFFMFNLYRGMWRYTSISDLINLIKATFVSSTIIILAILYLHRFEGYPRGVFIIDAFLTLFFIGGIRLFIRLFHQTPTSDLTHFHGISFCGVSTRFGLVYENPWKQHHCVFKYPVAMSCPLGFR
jgi:FlaA1/EpsC-like NDP-sugar epimerase